MLTPVLRAAATVALVLLTARPAGAQSTPETQPPTRPTLTPADLGAFLDGVVPLALTSRDITGVVIAVVKDGQLLLARGYGYADAARKEPVDPDGTLFRVASISKVINATAVMQLVETGKVSLDEDVSTYLDFELPRRFPDKITLRHLLTHTAGFEEAFKLLPADSGQGVALRDWIVQMAPSQLYRPGTITSYSNYGADLAGYVVERVSGMPYAEYVRIHILEPLGMRHSSIAQPLPAALAARLSREYSTASDSAGEFQILQGEPSGNLSATGADMARFMISHLASGAAPDSGRILQEPTARLMATTQFRTHPDIPGMALGFFEEHQNGYRIIGHGGDLARFHSHLSLVIDEGVGFFLSVNSSGTGAGFYNLREAVRDAFLNRYFPRTSPLEPIVADAAARSEAVAGNYTLSRRGESSLGRVASLLANVNLVANPDGSVEIPIVAGPNGQPMRWWPIGPTTFRNADGTAGIGYVPGADGLPDRVAVLGGHELHRVGTLDARSFNLFLIVASLATLALALVLWPVAALVRRRHGAAWRDDGVGAPLRAATRVSALAAIAFMVAFGVFIGRGLSEDLVLDSRVDWVLGLIRVLGLIGALGAVAGVVAFVRSIQRGRNGWARVKYGGLTLASLAFAWFTIHWNLLSWNFRY